MFEGVPTFLEPLKKIKIDFNGKTFPSQEHAYWCSIADPEIAIALRGISNTHHLRMIGRRLFPDIMENEEIQIRKAIFRNMLLQHEQTRRIFVSSEVNEHLKSVFDDVKDVPFKQLEIFDEKPGHSTTQANNQD